MNHRSYPIVKEGHKSPEMEELRRIMIDMTNKYYNEGFDIEVNLISVTDPKMPNLRVEGYALRLTTYEPFKTSSFISYKGTHEWWIEKEVVFWKTHQRDLDSAHVVRVPNIARQPFE